MVAFKVELWPSVALDDMLDQNMFCIEFSLIKFALCDNTWSLFLKHQGVTHSFGVAC